MTDMERLDWLDSDVDRLADVRGRMLNEDETVREAIDALIAAKKAEGKK